MSQHDRMFPCARRFVLVRREMIDFPLLDRSESLQQYPSDLWELVRNYFVYGSAGFSGPCAAMCRLWLHIAVGAPGLAPSWLVTTMPGRRPTWGSSWL
ncbi:hypothetical protein BHM03_00013369 [Ensete ventricosum]|nr:hypothetical protein BHM03_00013369 [Ensete ventricosum]